MGIKLQQTDDEYYILVNCGALYRQARKLKFRNAVLLKGELTDEDIDAMKKSDKVFVLAVYSDDKAYGGEIESRIAHAGITTVPWAFLIDEEDSDMYEKAKSLEDAVNSFPNRTAVESVLVSDGYIHDTDYANRCGNCSSKMAPEDNYCRYCGTKRGEGAFEPFFNPVYCVYGPPITTKYSCKKCGHKWITSALGGGEECRFCPLCGKNETEIIRRDIKDFWDVIGLIPDEGNPKLQLLSEKQIVQILSERDEEDEEKVFVDAGLEGAERLDEGQNLTETEGHRLTLARLLFIATEGSDIHGFQEKGICCPECDSKLIAAISYPLINDPYCDNKEGDGVFNGKHVSGNGNEVVLRDGAVVDWNKMVDGTEWNDRGQAFICMQCGKRFGRFEEYY